MRCVSTQHCFICLERNPQFRRLRWQHAWLPIEWNVRVRVKMVMHIAECVESKEQKKGTNINFFRGCPSNIP
eukprot:1959634-Amphidinium_carterae.1